MKKIVFVLLSFLTPAIMVAQSNTTEALQKKFDGSLSLYFYKNTLRMLNQTDNKEFDEIIKNIDKMRFLMIDKSQKEFSSEDYRKLTAGYKGESFESVMTARLDGRNLDVYLKDKKGSPLGTVILVNDSTSLYVLDILGSIDISKAGKLFSTLDQSSDIGQKIKSFMNKDNRQKGKREHEFNAE